MQRRLSGHDITLQQLSLLKQLCKNEFMLPNEIAGHLHCDRPTASVIISNLEKKGFVSKTKDQRNAKYHRVSISDIGRDYYNAVNASLAPLSVSPFDILSPEENELLYSLLKKCFDRTKEIINQTNKEQ